MDSAEHIRLVYLCLFMIKHLLPFLLNFVPRVCLCMFIYMAFTNDSKEPLNLSEVFRCVLTDWKSVKIYLCEP